MKSCQKSTTPLSQSTPYKSSLGDVCLPLSRIRGIAELFSARIPDEVRRLGCDASIGIPAILNDAADEIQTIVNDTIAGLAAEQEAEEETRAAENQRLYEIRCGEVAR